MKAIFRNTVHLLLFTTIGFSSSLFSQQAEVTIIQDERIPQLLELKAKMTRENKLSDRYKIQLYYGDLNEANRLKNRFDSRIGRWNSSIEYESPNYKVWIGNFRNRLEADRALLHIQREFPTAFVFQPGR